MQRIFIWNEPFRAYPICNIRFERAPCVLLWTHIIYLSDKSWVRLCGRPLQRHSLGAGGPKRHQFCRVLLQASIRVCVPNGNTPGMSKMYLTIVSTQRIWYFHSNNLHASRTYERRVQKLLRFCCRRPKQRPSEQHGHNGRRLLGKQNSFVCS